VLAETSFRRQINEFANQCKNINIKCSSSIRGSWGLQFQWSWGSTLGEYFPSNEETIFETLKPLGQYLSQAPFYMDVQPGLLPDLEVASFSPVPLRRGFLVHGRLAALVVAVCFLLPTMLGIAVFVRAEHSVCFVAFVLFVLLRWVCLVRRSWVVFHATRLMLEQNCGAGRRNLQSVGSQNNQNQRRLLLKGDWPFNNQGPEGPAAPVSTQYAYGALLRTEGEWRMADGGWRTAWACLCSSFHARASRSRAIQPKSSGHFVLGHRASGQAPDPWPLASSRASSLRGSEAGLVVAVLKNSIPASRGECQESSIPGGFDLHLPSRSPYYGSTTPPRRVNRV
jgi:hypothetical protein